MMNRRTFLRTVSASLLAALTVVILSAHAARE
jgi:hypothetical protein